MWSLGSLHIRTWYASLAILLGCFQWRGGGGETGERLKGFRRPMGFPATFINHPFLAFMKAFIHRENKNVGKGQLYFIL